MLDNLRFQEINKAIFRMKTDTVYGNKKILKGEPFLIIDDMSMSNFKVNRRDIISSGRSVESTTTTIESVSFNLVDGKIKMDLFNAIYGEEEEKDNTTFTVINTILLNNEKEFVLPSVPYGKVLLYLTDEYGRNIKIKEDQYTIEDKKIILIKEINSLITYVYEQETNLKYGTNIQQIGKDLIGTLELQCTALDIITEEKINILLKFNKVSISTNFLINFNNSSEVSSSIIYINAIPEDNQSIVNKKIFNIEII